jgi:anaerobic magnesium-protoporphyrin IX monomethyl ester cyclase
VTDLLPDEIGVSVSYPLPGTPFHQQVQAELGGKTNWRDSDDLELMHAGAYSPAFYRRLHRYTHHLFQARRGVAALQALRAAPLRAQPASLRRAALTAYFGPLAALDSWRLDRLQA